MVKTQSKLLKSIHQIIKQFPIYWNEGKLKTEQVAKDLRAYKKTLIEALLRDPFIKKTYTFQIESMSIFKIEEFIEMLSYQSFWENSYTRYQNQIGLASEDRYLKYNSDIVLDFPYKDCVLEAGMTREDTKKNEVYYHEIIAREELDTLLAPKALAKAIKYDKKEKTSLEAFQGNENLILKGNNLIAIQTLKERYAEKIKLIYIDPPYNTGGDENSFTYNNTFNHSTWLTFMKNRLEASYDLLMEDGFIVIAIDDSELFYLGVLMDEIYGRDNFIGLITVVHKPEGRNMEKFIATSTEYMLIYAKNKAAAEFNKIFFNQEVEKEFMKMKDEVGYFKPVNYLRSGGGDHNLRKNKPNFYYPIYVDPETLEIKGEKREGYKAIFPITESGQERTWKTVKDTFLEKLADDRMIALRDERDKIIICEKYYKSEHGELIKSHWIDRKYNAIHSGTNLLEKTIGRRAFSYPKSLYLVQDVLKMTMDNDDIVLDFFGGSGTTGHAVLDLNHQDGGRRRFIMCEQLENQIDIMIERMQKVLQQLELDEEFAFIELHRLNDQFITSLQQAKTNEEIDQMMDEFQENAYLNYNIDLEQFTKENEDFKKLSLEEKKEYSHICFRSKSTLLKLFRNRRPTIQYF